MATLLTFIKGHKISDKQINGKVFISFVINCNGKACDFKAYKNDFSNEDIFNIISILKTMPNWKPGRVKGVATDILFNIPVKIKNGWTY